MNGTGLLATPPRVRRRVAGIDPGLAAAMAAVGWLALYTVALGLAEETWGFRLGAAVQSALRLFLGR